MKNFYAGIKELLIEVIRTTTSREALNQHLRIPLYQNAYYLIASSAVSTALGVIFWIIVARLYTRAEVGLSTALIAATSLVALFSGLGLSFGLIRFLPGAGEGSTRMINSCLTLGGLTSVAASVIFIAGLHFWSPALLFLYEQPMYVAVFVAFTLIWALYSLLGNVFVALRTAKFAFLMQTIAAVAKIFMVIVFATLPGFFGIYGSMGLAITVGIVIGVLWFLPRLQSGYFPIPSMCRQVVNKLVPYSLGNYSTALLWSAPNFLLPLLVVNILGPESNAYFYASWIITSAIFVVPSAVSTSLFVESSHEEHLLLVTAKKALKVDFLILVPVIGMVFALGNKLLLLFGEAYSQNATTLLWILVLSAIPVSINSVYLTVQRVRKNIKRLMALSALVACLSLGLSCLLMLRMGLPGIGAGWLIGQSLVAGGVILFVVRVKRLHRRSENVK